MENQSALTPRLTAKSWKTRHEAYGSVLRDLKTNKMDIQACSKHIVGMISDANPQVMQEA